MTTVTNVKDIVLLDRHVFYLIIGMAAWGGLVRFVMLKKGDFGIHDISAVARQLVMSCFCGLILSFFILAHSGHQNKILMFAGLGGVFAGPIITLIGKKMASFIEKATLAPAIEQLDDKNLS